MVSKMYKFSDKKQETDASVNEVLVQELHKPMIQKIKRSNVYIKKRLWHRCFFCEFCKISQSKIFTEHLWVTASLTDKKSKTILDEFIEILAKFKCKPKKLWVDQGRAFYNTFTEKWLSNIDILIYSTY